MQFTALFDCESDMGESVVGERGEKGVEREAKTEGNSVLHVMKFRQHTDKIGTWVEIIYRWPDLGSSMVLCSIDCHKPTDISLSTD